jgi:predicted enzyme related to lactoylglutathione lyase
MKIRKSVWFEIYVDEMERATQFYEKVLDTKLEPLGDPSNQGTVMMKIPDDMESYGSGGALVKMEGFNAGGNSTLVYFHSKDCITEESRVTSAGGKIVKPKMSIGEHGFISLCLDTEGNMFGLHSME